MKINNNTNALQPDPKKQSHKDLRDIGTLTHAQLEAQLREIIPQNYASISHGVTNGDLHDHSGGDGGQIDYNSLANQPTIINPPVTTAVNDVQVGDGLGAWITNTIAQFITTLRATLDSVYAAAVHSHAWGTITGTLSSQTDLQTALNLKVDENATITSATKTKITYDVKGLVTAGADATTADIADSTNKRYVTDADLIDIGNLSGTNTGDETEATIETKLGLTFNNPFPIGRVLTTSESDGDIIRTTDLLLYSDAFGIQIGDTQYQGMANVNLYGNTGNATAPNTSAAAVIVMEYEDIAGNGALFKGYTSGGTKQTPTAVPADRNLAVYRGAGYGGSGAVFDAGSTGGMDIVSNQAQTATNKGTRIDFYTTPDNTASRVKALTINANGSLTIAPTGPADGTGLIKFTTERAWTLQQSGAAGAAMLEFFSDTAGKYVRINPNAAAAGGLYIGQYTSAVPEMLHVIGSGNIKAAVESTLSTGYAFSRLRNNTPANFDFGLYGSAHGSTLYGISTNSLAAVSTGAGALVLGTTGASSLYLGTNGTVRLTIDGTTGYLALGTTPTTTSLAKFTKVFTDTSGVLLGFDLSVFANPGGATTNYLYGAQITARSFQDSAQNFPNTFWGSTNNVAHQGTGIMTLAVGGEYYVSATKAGGTITNAYALNVKIGTLTGAITNYYGLKIDNITGAATLNYAIYTGTGLVRFGDTVTADLGMVVNESGTATADFRVESDTEANFIFLDANGNTDGTLYLGGSTNGIEIKKGGELRLIGTATRWNDLRVEPVVRTTGAKAPTFTAYKTNVYLYDFDNAIAASEKEVYFTIQLPHDWKEGSTIYPHVHWVNRTTGTAGHVIRWALDYTKAKIGGTFGATTNIVGTTIAGGGDITVADEHMITTLSTIDMTGDTISTILICRLYRNSSNAADTYTGTAGLLYFDIHYEIDSIGGSADEFTK